MTVSFKMPLFCHELKMKTEEIMPIRNTGVQHLFNLKGNSKS